MKRVAFLGAALLLACGVVFGEEAKPVRRVPLFDAVNQGLAETYLTAYSALSARVTLKNKTDETLELVLPDAFAGIPTAQFDDFGGGGSSGRSGGRSGRSGGGGSSYGGGNNSYGGGGGGYGGGGGNQMMGGGMGGMGGYGGGMGGGMMGGMGGGNYGGGGGGMYSVAPDQQPTVILKPNSSLKGDVRTVCLEHGKRDPHRGVKYTLAPIERATDNLEVQALCSLLANPTVDQQAVQAAAWHLNSGLSWDELANKVNRPDPRRPVAYPWFSGQQVSIAKVLVSKTREYVAAQQRDASQQKPTQYESRGSETTP
ncbi:MAG: hypothetical protein ACRC46_07000 [Thermoguttaceae bacterium]